MSFQETLDLLFSNFKFKGETLNLKSIIPLEKDHRVQIGMAEVSIDPEKFFARIEKLYEDWNSHKASSWGGAEALCIPLG